jgi:predicted ATP-grasp superfamily ATP-dependent carboligase
MDAVVTDAYVRSAVAGLRGLGRAGLDVLATGPRRSSAGLWSRFAARRALAPDVLEDPDGFARRIGELAAEHGPLVVYPGREESITAILHDALPEQAILPYPGAGPVDVVRDKRRIAEIAGGVGLGVPRVLAQATVGELVTMAAPPVPCVVKAASPAWRSRLGGTLLFSSRDDLREVLGRIPSDEPLIVQERVSGPITSLGIVIDREGRLVSRFEHRYRQTWHVEAGSVSSGVSVAPDEELHERAARMLAEVGYWGLAEVEVIGRNVVDVNPRFYGSLPLALGCGVNLPAVWHKVATDGAVPAIGPYRVGVHYRWLEGDLSALMHGHVRRALRVSPRPVMGAFWASDDPLPGVFLASDAIAIRARARLPGRRGRRPPAELQP